MTNVKAALKYKNYPNKKDILKLM